MTFELTGVIHKIFPTEQISDRFSKREFVLETSETMGTATYYEYPKFQLINDKCAMLDSYTEGEEVTVNFNIKGNKWDKDGEKKYFTNLSAWKVEAVGSEITGEAQKQSEAFGESSDLPF